MKTIIINFSLCVVLLMNINVSYSQNHSHKTSQDKMSADKRIKNYHTNIGNSGDGMAYNNGRNEWSKSKKKHKHNTGTWEQTQANHHWNSEAWNNPKHAWKYSNSRFFKGKSKKLKSGLKKGQSVGQEEKPDEPK